MKAYSASLRSACGGKNAFLKGLWMVMVIPSLDVNQTLKQQLKKMFWPVINIDFLLVSLLVFNIPGQYPGCSTVKTTYTILNSI